MFSRFLGLLAELPPTQPSTADVVVCESGYSQTIGLNEALRKFDYLNLDTSQAAPDIHGINGTKKTELKILSYRL
jgi:hypothetical protein